MPTAATTSRERELLELLGRGLTDKEIAAAMGIRYRTVRTHLERLYDRFGVTTRAGLIGTWLGNEQKIHRDVGAG